MELIKDRMAFPNFKKMEQNMKALIGNTNSTEKVTSIVDRFVWAFSTDHEQKQLDEFTYQIGSMIEKIYSEKDLMLNDIDSSYKFSSVLQTFCTERAKIYMNALDRIESYYGDKIIYNYIMEHKNL